jgi:hypothetical protein
LQISFFAVFVVRTEQHKIQKIKPKIGFWFLFLYTVRIGLNGEKPFASSRVVPRHRMDWCSPMFAPF